MVKRFALVEVVSFVLLIACAAVCQDVRPTLPDAPLVQTATRAQSLNVLEQARSPLEFGVMPGYAAVVRQSEFAATYRTASRQEKSRTIFEKYLAPSSPKQQGDRLSSNGSLMGRATNAASRIIVTRDESGRARLNTSYLLRALSSVAADTASTPYWRRSAGEPFSDFGSTVGGDAGMNVWHEVGPGLQHLMRNHAPKFVSRIEERIVHR